MMALSRRGKGLRTTLWALPDSWLRLRRMMSCLHRGKRLSACRQLSRGRMLRASLRPLSASVETVTGVLLAPSLSSIVTAVVTSERKAWVSNKSVSPSPCHDDWIECGKGHEFVTWHSDWRYIRSHKCIWSERKGHECMMSCHRCCGALRSSRATTIIGPGVDHTVYLDVQ